MNNLPKNLAIFIGLTFLMILLFNISKPQSAGTKKSYTEIIAAIESGAINSVILKGSEMKAIDEQGQVWVTNIPANDFKLIENIRSSGANITVLPPTTPYIYTLLGSLLQIVVFIAIFLFFMRQMQQSGGKAMSFGKSRAKLFNEEFKIKVTFKDVAGVEEAKAELEEIVEFLKDPSRFIRLGGRIPKGVLLMGSPGSGKTLLARAMGGEAQVPLLSISGSDFVEMFVGVGASRVRDLFSQAKKHAPCIIFIDEIDAVGRHRGSGLGGGHDEREQTLNQLLVEMDGFEHNEGLIFVAATNRPDVLDPALLRPGRIDRQVIVPLPDIKGREQILKIHATNRKVPMDKSVDLMVVARSTPGLSGADLENLVNEAALGAAIKNQDLVFADDFDNAKDKIIMGVERKSAIISDAEKRTTAWHEAGHALVSVLTPGSDLVHKVTIIPRGYALGLTHQLPMEEKFTYEKSFLMGKLILLMGGRVAEQVALNQLTTGAGSDLERATEIARKMVCEWGMSEKLGPLVYGQKEEQIFLGREMSRHRDYSETTAINIDDEIRFIVNGAYQIAFNLISTYRTFLDAIAEKLLEEETINNDILMEICAEAIKIENPDFFAQKKKFEKHKSKSSYDDKIKDETLPETQEVKIENKEDSAKKTEN